MSATILFSEGRMWAAREIGFVEIMSRAAKHCENDPIVCDLIGVARHTLALGLERYERPIRLRIERALHKAASELLEEMQSRSESSGEVEAVQRLIDLIDSDRGH